MKYFLRRWTILIFAFFLLAGCGGGGSGGSTSNNSTSNNNGGVTGPTANILYSPGWSTQTGGLQLLNGSASSGGTAPLTYSWSIQSKPAGSTTMINGADKAKAEFESDVAGSYVIQLVVSDGVTISQPATITITASGPATGWTRMGPVLDINYDQDATSPAMAADSSGNPVVAWEETDPNTANKNNIYAKKWNGTSWTQLGGALDTNIADDVYQPVVAIDPTDNNPAVVWLEQGSVCNVYVKKWNGSSWTALGGALNADPAKDAYTRASIAVSQTGRIYVAWEENVQNGAGSNFSGIFVARWNGSSWEQLGSPMSYSNINTYPALAIDPADGNPVLAWSHGAMNSTYYFGSVSVMKWDASTSTWTGLGNSPGYGLSAVNTALAIGSDSLPIIAWTDSYVGYPPFVTIMKYDGSSTFASYTTPYPGGGASSPSLLVAADNQPIVGFDGGGSILVEKWNPTGNAWIQYGAPVGYRSSPGTPSIAFGPSGKIIVNWYEPTNDNNVYVKIQQ